MSLQKLIAIIIITLNINTLKAQTTDYEALWKKINTANEKGLTKDANKIALQIFDAAIKTSNDVQQIKAAMHLMKFKNIVEEDNQQKNIFFVDTLIDKSKAPAKNILQSMQAELFNTFKQYNRYKLYNRTKLEEENSKDINTWSIDKINNTIAGLYNASLKNEIVLKNTLLKSIDPILEKGINTETLRPTIYDLLAHRAIDFFINGENDVTKPADKFIINDEIAFAKVDDFTVHTFKTKDTSSYYFHALKTFQKLLQFRQSDDKNIDALLDADLNRLAFVYSHGVFTNKEKMYENALLQIETKYSSSPTSAQAAYLRAMLLVQKGNGYNANNNTENQFELVKAKEILVTAAAKYPTSEGGINCKNELININRPSLRYEVEKVNTINEPFRALITYKNISNVYCRVIKLTRDEISKVYANENYYDLWKKIAALKPTKEWSQKLPQLNDLQSHSVEIKIDALPQGTYFLLMSKNENFDHTNNILCNNTVYVSNLSYVKNNRNEMYVLDRNEGTPIPNATVQVYTSKYDNSKNKYVEEKEKVYTSDKNGFIKTTRKNNQDYYINSRYYQIKTNTDELFTNDNEYEYYDDYIPRDNKRNHIALFTDRSIYRPGQIVYIKGIIMDTDSSGRNSKIKVGQKTKITLQDANYQKVSTQTFTTNEYGSFSGNFKLPEGLLNGSFHLHDSLTNYTNSFNVEEYKRPKFYTEIKKPTGTYKVNDSITVVGTAKAYAGNTIDGASVSYRVVRVVRYPIWWDYYGGFGRRGYNRGSEEMEITNGKTTTDAKGEFKIKFKAIPDETVDKKDQPTFEYKIIADVTDINGETRGANNFVAVSYQALKLDIEAEDNLTTKDLNKIKIKSTNTNNLFEKANVTTTIYKLIEPTKIFRTRYWQKPDVFVMNKEEYYKTFPYDMYASEEDKSTWETVLKISTADYTKENGEWNFNPTGITATWYKIVATAKDKYGEEVKAEKYVQLIDNVQQSTISKISFTKIKDAAEPGEKLQYNITTGYNKIWLIQNITSADNNAVTDNQMISNSNAYKKEILVAEKDRGGFYVSYIFVKHNRYYQGNEFLNVPWTNKDLKISYETFRDKLEPGSKEKWKVKITGTKAEKISAEALISMYDASLDQFKPHNWQGLQYLLPNATIYYNWNTQVFGEISANENYAIEDKYAQGKEKAYAEIMNNGWNDYNSGWEYKRKSANMRGREVMEMAAPSTMNEVVVASAPTMRKKEAVAVAERLESKSLSGNASDDEAKHLKLPKSNADLESENEVKTTPQNTEVKIRKNFNETAFFYPDLKTDAEGNISFEFTMPEALTQWKMMVLGHTKELASVYDTKTTVSQKQLMVQPNAPRFLREGDRMEFSAKVVNLTYKEITGTSQLELIDAATNKPLDGWFKNVFPNQFFTVAAGQSVAVKFPIDIPFNFNSTMLYRIKAVAKNGGFSDGEEAALPVLTNRMLVTESMPLNMRNTSKKDFKFEKLLASQASNSLSNHALTVEYTSNPAWYVVQALPYLIEYPYECAEQTFSRYYANTLAGYITNSSPKIKTVFEKWKTLDTAALLSNLQKNEELKSVLLQETPWVLAAQNENEQKKNIALLFDLVKLAAEKDKALNKLKEMQSSNGGFVWFKGGRDDRYITQYIITGIGHLRKLKAITENDYTALQPIVDKALPYLDAKLTEEYKDLIKYKAKLTNNNLSYTAIQYLYMRSFFAETNIAASNKTAVDYYKGQAEKYWVSQSKYMQAMIALALHRNDNSKIPKAIIESLKQNSISNEEFGMYWKEFNSGGYYWHQAPIESHALMIEAFRDIDKNENTINDLKTWLLKQKQTQNWKTTKATAEACYALLLSLPTLQRGDSQTSILDRDPTVEIKFENGTVINSSEGAEAGTGYFKKKFLGEKVSPSMGNITVTVNSTNQIPPSGSGGATSWGGVYWQYFENLDKITAAETPLKLSKKLFIETNSPKGPLLKAINDGDEINIGDKIKVRIELRVDRAMEYVHMKDMRASCMEPTNVISQYKWQGGLGYYETTKDASTNFFFGWLPKGTYVFEYSMFVTHAGNFSNGITTIQCIYAPEFTSHSEGVRVSVK